jgi:hypothetical protein
MDRTLKACLAIIILAGLSSAYGGASSADASPAAALPVGPLGEEPVEPVNMSAQELMSPYECIGFIGLDPDSFILVYQNAKGARLLTIGQTAARRKGVGMIGVDVGVLKDRDVRILQCFLGKYYPGNRAFVRSPRLLCPRTGAAEDFYMSRMGMRDFRVFADRCVPRPQV